MQLIVSVRASAGTLRVKWPLTSVTTPVPGKSVHTTLAAMTGSLSMEERTVPVTVTCFLCAHATPNARKRSNRDSTLFLISQ